jgi:hypothetical protein
MGYRPVFALDDFVLAHVDGVGAVAVRAVLGDFSGLASDAEFVVAARSGLGVSPDATALAGTARQFGSIRMAMTWRGFGLAYLRKFPT